MISHIESLPNTVTDSIKEFISQKQIPTSPLIRDDIFNILEKYCTVLYFPLKNEENDGCHVQRFVNNQVENFVYINTHKSIEKQIFTAAHELGHILELNLFLKDHCPDYNTELEETAMNQFAALVLMPDEIFLSQVKNNFTKYSTESDTITFENLICAICMSSFVCTVFCNGDFISRCIFCECSQAHCHNHCQSNNQAKHFLKSLIHVHDPFFRL